MELTVLKFFYFLRPLLFADVPLHVFGLGFFELATLMSTALLGLIPLSQVALRTSRPWRAEHYASIAFIVWCTAAFLLYRQDSDFKLYLKWILPWITMFICISVIHDERAWTGAAKWMLAGFSIPILASTYLTVTGKGMAQEIYWTKLDRYRGVYDNIHNMGHNMGLFIMLSALYFAVIRARRRNPEEKRDGDTLFALGIAVLMLPALYCLYKTQVRTVYIGLGIFALAWAFFARRYVLAVMMAGAGALVYTAAPIVKLIFFDVVDAAQGKTDIETAGSGRPFIWGHNLKLFADAPFDRQLGGFGVGNYGFSLGGRSLGTNIWNSHNDFLDTMMQTGLIGLALMLTIYAIIGYRVWKSQSAARNGLLAFFCAIVFMNLASNSYITRFGLAQAFVMISCLAMATDPAPQAQTGPAPAPSKREAPRRPSPVRPRAPAAVPSGRAVVGAAIRKRAQS